MRPRRAARCVCSLALGEPREDDGKAEVGERGKAAGDGDVAVLVVRQESSAPPPCTVGVGTFYFPHTTAEDHRSRLSLEILPSLAEKV